MDEETYLNFKEYHLHKTILKLFDDKCPILSVRLDDNSTNIGLSIIEDESGMKFKIPDQPIGKALLTFLEARKYHEEICFMVGFYRL